MGNWGIRISKSGTDVKTGSDKDMIVTSKYSQLKGIIEGNGSIVVAANATGTVTVAHNLGYIPFADGYIKHPLDSNWLQNPTTADGGLYAIQTWHYMDSTNLYMKFKVIGGSSSRTFNYQYFIFLDKGKL